LRQFITVGQIDATFNGPRHAVVHAAPFTALQGLYATGNIFFNQLNVAAVKAQLAQHVVKKHTGLWIRF
jgi:hypothetical protein